jgi:hypothetical protein
MEPDEPCNYCNLSDWYMMTERDLTLAGYYIQQNIMKDPNDYKPYMNFAGLWRMLKNYPQAKANITKCKERATGYASPYIHQVIDQQIKWIDMELEGKPATPTVEDVQKE